MKRTLGVGPLHLSRRLLQLCGRGESHPVSPGAWFPIRGGKAPRGGRSPWPRLCRPLRSPSPSSAHPPVFTCSGLENEAAGFLGLGEMQRRASGGPWAPAWRIPSCFRCWGTSFASRSAAEMGDAATQVAPVRAGVLSSCHEGVVTWRSRETPCC